MPLCLFMEIEMFLLTAPKDLQNYIDIETNWYEVEIFSPLFCNHVPKFGKNVHLQHMHFFILVITKVW